MLRFLLWHLNFPVNLSQRGSNDLLAFGGCRINVPHGWVRRRALLSGTNALAITWRFLLNLKVSSFLKIVRGIRNRLLKMILSNVGIRPHWIIILPRHSICGFNNLISYLTFYLYHTRCISMILYASRISSSFLIIII